MAELNEHKFSPAWWLRGPHAQTLWSQFFRRSRLPNVRTEEAATSDGDHLTLYHLDVHPAAPRLLLLHGLEGGIQSHYVGGLLSDAARRQWNATLLVFRGCGPNLNSAPRLYHSGETTDLDHVVGLTTRRSPGAPLLLAGVSLGGNVLLKWLGERADALPPQVKGAGAISVPFDLEAGSRNLQRGFARVYDRHFLRSLRRKAWSKLRQYPGLFDPRRLVAARTIEDFDDAVTAPVHGFTGSSDYYRQSSSLAWLDRIQVPTLLISAEDDPFLPSAVLNRVREAARANQHLRLEFSPHGGHVGFVAGRLPFRAVYWAENHLMDFLASLI